MDCKPYFNIEKVKAYISNFLKKDIFEEDTSAELKNSFIEVQKNYQNYFFIGCFTDSPDNHEMWKKYSNNSTGFCVEYSTLGNNIFTHNMLPVYYTDNDYDCSLAFADWLILQANRTAKNRTLYEDVKVMGHIYNRVSKASMIPIFLKKRKWQFESEYRVFFTKSMIKKNEIEIDQNRNINISRAINAIYLGDEFDIKNNQEIFKNLLGIIKKQNISLYQKKYNGLSYDTIPIYPD